MEQWQFLIQKQGDRAWQSLESPDVEILEGRYRVVARSHRTNTDVEVRVTHSSSEETPPRRRIHKRSRRTNAEGLMAVIPFTYFEKGLWEVRCSGDLMSDMLGLPWQQTIRLQVLPNANAMPPTPVNDDMGGDEVQSVSSMSSIFTAVSSDDVSDTYISQTPTSSDPQIATTSNLPVPPIPPNFAKIALLTDSKNLDSENTEASHSFAHTVENRLSATASNVTVAQTYPYQEQIIERIVIDSDTHIPIADPEGEVNISELEATPNATVVENTKENFTIRQLGELQPLAGAEIEEISILNGVSVKPNTDYAELPPVSSTEAQIELNEPISITPVVANYTALVASNHNNGIADAAIDELVNLTINNITEEIRQNEREEAIINQLANPVWVKGETAEQILHNLIELALPASEPLLGELVNQSQIDNVPLPLLLTLDEQAYVARWGRPLTIYGRAQLIQDLSNDASEFESILKGELRIELLEPQGLEVIVQAQQSLSEKLLPFGFEFSVDIPAHSQSKLLLADISLYGSLGGVEDPVLLATQSFIVTADVTELLAASATAKPSEPDMLDPLAALTKEPEAVAVAIDLELFNLVKTAKTAQSQLQPSKKQVLPPQVEPRKYKRTNTRHPQLPFSQNQDQVNAFATATLPFLKKRPAPLIEEEIPNSTVVDDLEGLESSTDISETLINVETHLPTETSDELVADNMHFQGTEILSENATPDNEVVPETDIAMLNPDDATSDSSLPQQTLPPRSQFIGVNRPQISPLIQKWIQSQGYSLSETINLQYSSFDIPNTVNVEADRTSSHNTDLPIDTVAVVQDSEPVREPPIQESLQLPNTPNLKTPPAWLAQEIVIDDTFDYISDDAPTVSPSEAEAPKVINNLLNSLPVLASNIEPLPIPKLILPTSDLISGRTIRVRVLLSEMPYSQGSRQELKHLAIKIWVEDCQTRWLLEGPHLLTLLPSTSSKGTEAYAELNIPFGCLEIRIEAIAFDMATQQESHKVSIQRTVIPPDLPTLQYDELLGI